ncbi:MAG: SDR family oxidoreductase [Calditrichia bacterium]
MNLKDKTVLITGSSQRVGKVIAITLARAGARIVIHYHTQEKEAVQTAKEIRSFGKDVLIVKGDISKKNDWMAMRNNVLEKWGRIDVLVNNAAIFYRTPLFDISEKDWNHFLDVNLKGTFWGCQVIGEFMTKNKSGKIINIADVSADHVWAGYIPYCTSKAGVVALTRGLAKALAPHVTINAVAPGTVLLAEEYDEEEENYLIERTPLKRIGSPEDIANAVRFLIEGSDFITGTVINVDGGRSIN